MASGASVKQIYNLVSSEDEDVQSTGDQGLEVHDKDELSDDVGAVAPRTLGGVEVVSLSSASDNEATDIMISVDEASLSLLNSSAADNPTVESSAPDATPTSSAAGAGPPRRKRPQSARYFAPDVGIKCHKCGQVGHMAAGCMNQRQSAPCYMCGEHGHFAAGCPNELCFRCYEPGHQHRDCRNPRFRPCTCFLCGSSTHVQSNCRKHHVLDEIRCYVCGTFGHWNCKQVKARADTYCPNCGDKGHSFHECREPPADLDRFPMDARRDAGRTCYLCGQVGHLSRACPKRRGSSRRSASVAARYPSSMLCYRCNEAGHMAAHCPLNTRAQPGRRSHSVGRGRLSGHGNSLDRSRRHPSTDSRREPSYSRTFSGGGRYEDDQEEEYMRSRFTGSQQEWGPRGPRHAGGSSYPRSGRSPSSGRGQQWPRSRSPPSRRYHPTRSRSPPVSRSVGRKPQGDVRLQVTVDSRSRTHKQRGRDRAVRYSVNSNAALAGIGKNKRSRSASQARGAKRQKKPTSQGRGNPNKRKGAGLAQLESKKKKKKKRKNEQKAKKNGK